MQEYVDEEVNCNNCGKHLFWKSTITIPRDTFKVSFLDNRINYYCTYCIRKISKYYLSEVL